jgi:hypothetical protein
MAFETQMEEFMAHKFGMVAILVGLSMFTVPVFAHHGAASFDSGKTITVKGTVVGYVWSNPHVLVKMDSKDDKGEVIHWVVEAWNPVTQTSRGWTKNSFKPGDEVEAEVVPAKNNQPVAEFRGKVLINGKQLQ